MLKIKIDLYIQIEKLIENLSFRREKTSAGHLFLRSSDLYAEKSKWSYIQYAAH